MSNQTTNTNRNKAENKWKKIRETPRHKSKGENSRAQLPRNWRKRTIISILFLPTDNLFQTLKRTHQITRHFPTISPLPQTCQTGGPPRQKKQSEKRGRGRAEQAIKGREKERGDKSINKTGSFGGQILPFRDELLSCVLYYEEFAAGFHVIRGLDEPERLSLQEGHGLCFEGLEMIKRRGEKKMKNFRAGEPLGNCVWRSKPRASVQLLPDAFLFRYFDALSRLFFPSGVQLDSYLDQNDRE